MTTVTYDVQVYMTIELHSDELIFDCASDIIWGHIESINSDLIVNDLEVSSA